MDRFLDVIVGGAISPATRSTLLKQLDQEIDAKSRPPASQPAALEMTRESDMMMEDNAGPRPRRREVARAEAVISDPVTRIVGLILGSPEFQRQ